MSTQLVKRITLIILAVFAIGVVFHMLNFGVIPNAYTVPIDNNSPYDSEIDQSENEPENNDLFNWHILFTPNNTEDSEITTTPAQEDDIQAMVDDPLVINFLDTGNSDCTLIQLDNKNFLIDTGDTDDAAKIIEYLQGRNINKLDALILTHPHNDHIGSAAKIIANIEIDKIYMPKIPDEYVPTTKTYENLLKAIVEKNVSVSSPEVGDIIAEGDYYSFFFLNSSNGDFSWKKSDMNRYSLVTYLTFAGNNYIFTGDADTKNEEEILKEWSDVDLDFDTVLIKPGHHCSRTATSNEWLDNTTPEYAICSCGKGNSYGHPHSEVLEKLKNRSVKVYRNDIDKTIQLIDYGNYQDIQTGLPSVNGSETSYSK